MLYGQSKSAGSCGHFKFHTKRDATFQLRLASSHGSTAKPASGLCVDAKTAGLATTSLVSEGARSRIDARLLGEVGPADASDVDELRHKLHGVAATPCPRRRDELAPRSAK